MISGSIILSLVFTLFPGLAVGQSMVSYVNEPITRTGYVSVSAVAFEPDGIRSPLEIRNYGEKVVNLYGLVQI